METWQPQMLEKLVSHLQKDGEVLGLMLFGSCAQLAAALEEWSDIDLLLVVRDHSLERFYPTLAWIEQIDRIYTYSQSADEHKSTTRICFENMDRVDFVITTPDQLSEINHWQGIPFRSGVHTLFSRAGVVDQLASLIWPPSPLPPVPEDRFQYMVRDFRFKSMLAIYKVVRDDLLIALHLVQDLVRDCCVLGMMLRDRATGTDIHKHGGIGNQTVEALQITQHPFTPLGLLDSIQACQIAFDKLACEWSNTYVPNRQPILDWIDKARTKVTTI